MWIQSNYRSREYIDRVIRPTFAFIAPGKILNAIEEAFDTEIFSEYDMPQA
jgi:hypothetical protein